MDGPEPLIKPVQCSVMKPAREQNPAIGRGTAAMARRVSSYADAAQAVAFGHSARGAGYTGADDFLAGFKLLDPVGHARVVSASSGICLRLEGVEGLLGSGLWPCGGARSCLKRTLLGQRA